MGTPSSSNPCSSPRDHADLATMLVWMSDPSGVCTYLHSSATQTSPKRADFHVREWMEFIHPEDRVWVHPAVKQAMVSRQEYQFEYRLVHSNGSIRWMRSSAAPRMSDTGEFLGYIGAITECTQLREVLLELEKSEGVLRLMMQHSSDIISHHAPDSGNYWYVSPSAEALLGFKPSELLGISCYDTVHPDDREIVRAEILRQAQGDNDSRLLEFRVRHKAGHYVWIGAKARVLLDPSTREKLGAVVVSRDITAERHAREELRKSEERFRSLADLSSDWYWESDEHGRITYISDGLTRLLGATPEEVIGKTRRERTTNKDQPGLKEYEAKMARREPFRDIEYSAYVPAKGTVQHAALSGEPVFEDGKFIGYRGVGRDITERIQTERHLAQMATHDTLTGLPNRTLLNQRLQHMLETSDEKRSVVVLFIDLDRFKEINDTMGHGPGDELLKEVAQRLRNNVRPDDVVARLGGDEFVVAAHCSYGTHSATRLVQKLWAALAQPMELAGQEVFVRASVGISMSPQHGITKETLLQNADIAMYRAKESGRNGYRFFEEEMSAQAKRRMIIENSLHRALERNEFELHYQPQLKLETMEVVGMEALVRWNHPLLGRVSPLEFIPVAEERGVIAAIGKWVLEEACRQTRRLIDTHNRPIRISVNLSARQLKNERLVEDVREALENNGLHAHLLELELTESALIDDIKLSTEVFHQLKSLGVSLAVDDFGTGYSGLAYLGQFPLDVLKLDRSFVNQTGRSGSGNRRVIRAFIEMAHTLDLSVVAEGVETEDMRDFLKDAACDEAQGYLFARPLPIDELDTFFCK